MPVSRPVAARPPAIPVVAAALTAGVVLVIYVATLAPTTQFWDTSEYIAAAKVLGIPHPPGNPLFVLLAHVWGMLPWAEHYALRINLFAAVTSAAASGLLFLVSERALRALIGDQWLRVATAFAGGLVGATSFTVWHQSVVNEKVYTLSLFFIALVLWLAFRWADAPPGPRRDRVALLMLYLLALTSTNHLMGVLAGTAVVAIGWQTLREDDPGGAAARSEWAKWLVVAAGAGVLMLLGMENPAVLAIGAVAVIGAGAAAGITGNWRFAVAALAVIAVGLSVNAFLPIRAAHYPAINEGEPTTWQAFWSVFTREQYQKPPLTERQAPLAAQYANYLQYFGWQFAHDYAPPVRRFWAVVFGALGLAGAIRHWQVDRRRAVALTALMLTVTVVLVFYLNFRYGYSIYPGADLDREVRERDYFFVASFQLWGVWVALGLGAVVELAGRWAAQAPASLRRAVPAVLLVAAVPLWSNRLTASRAGETLPRDFAVDLLESLEPYAILVTAGDNDTFPLWYAQEVERVRRDVTLVNLSLGNTLWHVRQIARRPQEPFDATRARPPYRGGAWPMPDRPALAMSEAQINQLPLYVSLGDRRLFRAGTLRAVLGGQVLPGVPGEYLDRATIVVLQMISQNLGHRPIYFSRTVGNYADLLGLGPFLVGHGLARQLTADSVAASDTIINLRGQGWVHIPRTETLLFDVYHPESAARPRPRGWVDDPSIGILSLYALVYSTYGEWALRQGDSVRSARGARAIALADRMFEQIPTRGN